MIDGPPLWDLKIHGQSRYDAEAARLLDETRAALVLLVIVGGTKGPGFVIKNTTEQQAKQPATLRAIAQALEAAADDAERINRGLGIR